MNYEWNKIVDERSCNDIGAVEVYTTVAKSNHSQNHVLSIISYPPECISGSVNICLYFKGVKEAITDGYFHWIMNDLADLAMQNYSGEKPFFTQTFIVSELPDISYFTHGDFSIN